MASRHCTASAASRGMRCLGSAPGRTSAPKEGPAPAGCWASGPLRVRCWCGNAPHAANCAANSPSAHGAGRSRRSCVPPRVKLRCACAQWVRSSITSRSLIGQSAKSSSHEQDLAAAHQRCLGQCTTHRVVEAAARFDRRAGRFVLIHRDPPSSSACSQPAWAHWSSKRPRIGAQPTHSARHRGCAGRPAGASVSHRARRPETTRR